MVTVTVERAPFAVNDTATVAMNSVNDVINVLANDLDPDGTPISVVSVTQGARGSVSFGPGGANVVYSPDPGFFGADTFTYTISDGLATASATVNVTVDRAPVAVDDAVMVFPNSVNNPVNVLANGSDPNPHTIGVIAVTGAAHGVVAVGSGGADVVYTPAAGFSGTDSFIYAISNGDLTASASVTVNVTGHVAPLAANDTLSVPVNSANNALRVLSNDRDPDGESVLVSSVSSPKNGTVVVGPGGTMVIYTPNPGFTGTDTFTYIITDGFVLASATVDVTVHSGNNPPRAVNDSVTVLTDSSDNPVNVLANDNDPDSDPISVASVTQGSKGSVTIGTGRGDVRYTPNPGVSGTDAFTYTIVDGAMTANATVNVAIQGSKIFLPLAGRGYSGGW